MIIKHPLRPERVRQVPSSFSWVDHRLIRHDHLADCDPPAWALYLFLVSVGDVQGLSYYSDAAITRRLKLDLLQLAAARQQLVGADLLAYRKPLYQVLALPESSTPPPSTSRTGQAQSAGQLLRRALTGGAL